MATNPPITIGELVDVPAPGAGVKSQWSQEVTRRCVHRFATVAARDAQYPAAAAGAGAYCTTLDTGILWTVVGVAWVPAAVVAANGVIVSRAGQVIPTSAATVVSFTVETADVDGWHAPNDSQLIVPAGRAGPRTITANGAWSASAGAQNALAVFINAVAIQEAVAGTVFNFPLFTVGLTLRRTFVAGDVITFQVFQNSGSNKNLDLRVEVSGW